MICLFIIDIVMGSVTIPLKETLNIIFGQGSSKNSWEIILFEFRIPKAITAILVGSALSLSGLLMQTLFRNPLAGPYVLGISSGASLGVALALLGAGYFGINVINSMGFAGNWTLAMSSWIGSGIVLLIIFVVSLYIRDITTILILGIMFGTAIGALVNILQYFSNEAVLKTYIIWTMGSLGGVSKSQLYIMIPAIIIGYIIAISLIKSLNALLLGENYARSMGVNYKSARIWIIICTTVLAGTATAFCGPIGFIGIAVPHICKMIFKTSNHKVLVPVSLIVGAIFLLCSDIISHLPSSQQSLPVNSVTAFLGAPFVIWIILGKRRIKSLFT